MLLRMNFTFQACIMSALLLKYSWLGIDVLYVFWHVPCVTTPNLVILIVPQGEASTFDRDRRSLHAQSTFLNGLHNVTLHSEQNAHILCTIAKMRLW